MKRIVGPILQLSAKAYFSLDKYQLNIWVENTVCAIQHIENKKKVLLKCSYHDQTYPVAYICSFTFHTTYKNDMIGHGGWKLSKCSKTKYQITY